MGGPFDRLWDSTPVPPRRSSFDQLWGMDAQPETIDFTPLTSGPQPGGLFDHLGQTLELTSVPQAQEAAFQTWLDQNQVHDLDQGDYDYRGAFQAGVSRGPDGHWPDTFKQHGHPTFSEESQYSRGPGDGGTWAGDTFVPPPAGPPDYTRPMPVEAQEAITPPDQPRGPFSQALQDQYDLLRGEVSGVYGMAVDLPRQVLALPFSPQSRAERESEQANAYAIAQGLIPWPPPQDTSHPPGSATQAQPGAAGATVEPPSLTGQVPELLRGLIPDPLTHAKQLWNAPDPYTAGEGAVALGADAGIIAGATHGAVRAGELGKGFLDAFKAHQDPYRAMRGYDPTVRPAGNFDQLWESIGEGSRPPWEPPPGEPPTPPDVTVSRETPAPEGHRSAFDPYWDTPEGQAPPPAPVPMAGGALEAFDRETAAGEQRMAESGVLPAEVQTVLHEVDNLGFDTAQEAANAILADPSWSTTWDLLDVPDDAMALLERWRSEATTQPPGAVAGGIMGKTPEELERILHPSNGLPEGVSDPAQRQSVENLTNQAIDQDAVEELVGEQTHQANPNAFDPTRPTGRVLVTRTENGKTYQQHADLVGMHEKKALVVYREAGNQAGTPRAVDPAAIAWHDPDYYSKGKKAGGFADALAKQKATPAAGVPVLPRTDGGGMQQTGKLPAPYDALDVLTGRLQTAATREELVQLRADITATRNAKGTQAIYSELSVLQGKVTRAIKKLGEEPRIQGGEGAGRRPPKEERPRQFYDAPYREARNRVLSAAGEVGASGGPEGLAAELGRFEEQFGPEARREIEANLDQNFGPENWRPNWVPGEGKPVPGLKVNGPFQEALAKKKEGRLQVREGTYRGKKGFTVSGTNPAGKRVSIFTESRGSAERIQEKIRAGQEVTTEDFHEPQAAPPEHVPMAKQKGPAAPRQGDTFHGRFVYREPDPERVKADVYRDADDVDIRIPYKGSTTMARREDTGQPEVATVVGASGEHVRVRFKDGTSRSGDFEDVLGSTPGEPKLPKVKGNAQKGVPAAREYVAEEGATPEQLHVREVTRKIKEGDAAAIEEAATEMAKRIPEGAILIPIPGHAPAAGGSAWGLAMALMKKVRGAQAWAAVKRVKDIPSTYEARRAGERPPTLTQQLESLEIANAIKSAKDRARPVVLIDNIEVSGTAARAVRAKLGLPGDTPLVTYSKGPIPALEREHVPPADYVPPTPAPRAEPPASSQRWDVATQGEKPVGEMTDAEIREVLGRKGIYSGRRQVLQTELSRRIQENGPKPEWKLASESPPMKLRPGDAWSGGVAPDGTKWMSDGHIMFRREDVPPNRAKLVGKRHGEREIPDKAMESLVTGWQEKEKGGIPGEVLGRLDVAVDPAIPKRDRPKLDAMTLLVPKDAKRGGHPILVNSHMLQLLQDVAKPDEWRLPKRVEGGRLYSAIAAYRQGELVGLIMPLADDSFAALTGGDIVATAKALRAKQKGDTFRSGMGAPKQPIPPAGGGAVVNLTGKKKGFSQAYQDQLAARQARAQAAKQGALPAPIPPGALPKGEPMVVGVHRAITQLWSPAAVEDAAGAMANTISWKNAERAHDIAKAEHALRDAGAYARGLSRPEQMALNEAIETGAQLPEPKQAALAAQFRTLLDVEARKIQALGTGKLEHLIQHYLPHIWTDPVKAAQVMGRMQARRPFEGSKSFLKRRTVPTMREGIDAGLVPVTYNPIELALLKYHEMRRYRMAVEIMQAEKEAGRLTFVHVEGHAPAGSVRINDPAFTLFGPPSLVVQEAFDAGIREGLQAAIKRFPTLRHERAVRIGGKRWGYAEGPEGKRMVTKFGGENFIMTHELGHILDFRYKLWNELVSPAPREQHTAKRGKRAGQTFERAQPQKPEVVAARVTIKEELRALADLRFEGKEQETSQHFKDYTRDKYEQMANAIHARIHAPERMRAVAPTVYDRLTRFLEAHPETKPLLDLKPGLRLGSEAALAKLPGYPLLGHFYAQGPVARVLNNFLSPGLRGNAIYDAYMGVGNTLNQAQLGLSAFHLGFTSFDVATSKLALAIEQAWSGHPLAAAKSVAAVPAAPIANVLRGRRLRAEYLEPGSHPEMAPLAEALDQAGGRVLQEERYRNNSLKKLLEAVRAHQPVRAARYSLPALFEWAAKPIMEVVVPAQKLGVFADRAQFELSRMPKDATPAEVTRRMQTIWASVDNRLGQMVYDNLYWNKVFKDVLHATVRAVGWDVGTIRELGGGTADIARLRRTPRAAYTIALPIMVGMSGAVIGYMYHLANGAPLPRTLKDLYYPRTGRKDAEGNDERVQLPSYMKDVLAFARHPVRTLVHKAHPLMAVLGEMLSNENYYGDQIRNPRDPLVAQVKQEVAHLLTVVLPFGIQNVTRESGQSPTTKALNFVGITPAPREVVRTPAQTFIHDELQRRGGGSATPEEAEAQAERRQLQKDFRAGKVTREELQRMQHEGAITRALRKRMEKNQKLDLGTIRFKQLGLEAAEEAYRLGNPEEQKAWLPLLQRKRWNTLRELERAGVQGAQVEALRRHFSGLRH